jgi:hypothetical protein
MTAPCPSSSSYRDGCRCDPCKAWNRARAQAWRAERRRRGLDPYPSRAVPGAQRGRPPRQRDRFRQSNAD